MQLRIPIPTWGEIGIAAVVVAFVVYEWREFHPQPKEVIATQEVRRIEPTPEPEEKTIVVHGYFRKDGVYVKEHIRHVK